MWCTIVLKTIHTKTYLIGNSSVLKTSSIKYPEEIMFKIQILTFQWKTMLFLFGIKFSMNLRADLNYLRRLMSNYAWCKGRHYFKLSDLLNKSLQLLISVKLFFKYCDFLVRFLLQNHIIQTDLVLGRDLSYNYLQMILVTCESHFCCANQTKVWMSCGVQSVNLCHIPRCLETTAFLKQHSLHLTF